jgi:hypothetical protein
MMKLEGPNHSQADAGAMPLDLQNFELNKILFFIHI